jgi:putative phage-type endonuclease
MNARRFRSHEAWLRARRIGSSDVAPILGLSPYRSAWDVYERLVHGRQEDAGDAARRGQLLEPYVLRRYSAETGRPVRRAPPFTLFDRDEWATATPDAFGDDEVPVVEAKTDRHRERWGEPTTITRWEPATEKIVRPDYYLQVQHQLFVLDAPAADLAVLLPGDDPFLPELRVYRIERDLEVEAALVERLRGWWQQHIVGKEPPPFDGSFAATRYLTRRQRMGSRRAVAAEAQLAAEYEAARRMEDDWSRRRKQLSQQIVAAAGDVAQLDLPVGRITIVRNEGRSTLDERALLADHPELAGVLDQYRRRGEPYTYPRISGVGGQP